MQYRHGRAEKRLSFFCDEHEVLTTKCSSEGSVVKVSYPSKKILIVHVSCANLTIFSLCFYDFVHELLLYGKKEVYFGRLLSDGIGTFFLVCIGFTRFHSKIRYLTIHILCAYV